MNNMTLLRYQLLSVMTVGKKRCHYRYKVSSLTQPLETPVVSEKMPESYDVLGDNNQLFLYDEHGNETLVPFHKIDGVHIDINGSHNTIKIPNPKVNGHNFCLHLSVLGNHNKIDLHKGVWGRWSATAYGDNNVFEVGKNTSCGSFSISLHSNTFKIGKNCMISSEEELWTDGHSVVDYATNNVLNKPSTPILIGNHVWVGRRATFTKGAQVPDNCIVGIGSVVTKKFTEPNCVIAGNPARVVKRGISWDGRPPLTYEQAVSHNYYPMTIEHKNRPNIFFIHCADKTNIGDTLCTPIALFKAYKKTHNQIVMDIREDMPLSRIGADDIVILGGGGLLNYTDDWNERINQLLSLPTKVIAWGVGFNTHYDDTDEKLPIAFNRFCLFSGRDWLGQRDNYCPCVSCLNPKVHKKYSLLRHIGIVEHKENPIPLAYDRISNRADEKKDIFSFIGSSNVIITNTYHGAYWGLLMGKKVILYHPFSSRFDALKYLPTIYSGDLEQDIAIAKIYPEFLRESCDLNKKFFDKVQNMIKGKN